MEVANENDQRPPDQLFMINTYIGLLSIRVDSYRADWRNRAGLSLGLVDLQRVQRGPNLRAKGVL